MLRLSLAALMLVSLTAATPRRESRPLTTPELATRALQSVVLVVASDSAGNAIRQGSGFFVSSDGLLVTNHHVVDGCDTATVKRPDGSFFLVSGVLSADIGHDLVLLQVSGKNFTPLPVALSNNVQIGQSVVAVGNPLALEGTVSTGIVSGIREVGDTSLIQTTAPISPGSSGGVLLNERGEVIGVTTLQYSSGQNLNFAVPADLVNALITSRRDLTPFAKSVTDSKPRTIADVPLRWKHLFDNSEWNIRVDGEYLYEEGILPEAVRKDGGFILCETKRVGSIWVGTCRSRLPYRCGKTWRWCAIDSKETITGFTAKRIEGQSQSFEPRDFDCGSCKPTAWIAKDFVLIPSNP